MADSEKPLNRVRRKYKYKQRSVLNRKFCEQKSATINKQNR